ncbi:MAG: helix-turn-helix transcriptional regulator [Candidatus Thorarchaeota archaeon]|nr:helix-turn-helix transcriptional regulator [Candidatus Thorarchaeota archaeon]
MVWRVVITNKLKEYREQKMRLASNSSDWTQETIALRVGVTRQTIISIEKGTYNPSLELAFRLASLLNVRIDDLFQFEGDEIEY